MASAQPVVVVEDSNIDQIYQTYVRASLVRRALTRAGLAYDVVPDRELPRRELARQQVVVLPANPGLNGAAIEWLKSFTARGGTVIICPPLPLGLGPLVGVASVEAMTTASDERLTGIEFERALAPSLPAQWRQLDWEYQPFKPIPTAKVVGRWRSPERSLDQDPAVVLAPGGAFCSAVLAGDDRSTEAWLLLAIATHYHPPLWRVAIPRVLESVGQVGDARSLRDIKDRLNATRLPPERRAAALTEVNTATDRLANARELYRKGLEEARRTKPPVTSTPAQRYLPAAELAWNAQLAAEQAYYLSQCGRDKEFRGVWLQNAQGLAGWDWQQVILALRDGNFNALFINVANGGYADYPSAFLPHVRGADPDPLQEITRWCRALGVECHAWLMGNYLRPATPAEFRHQLATEGRLQIDRDGRALGWLRPADPRNQRLLADVAAELAARYPLDGIHLDYLRYSPAGDYGQTERSAFEATLSGPLVDWPDEVLTAGATRMRWLEWRIEQVNAQVRQIAVAARAARPGLRVSAAVYPIWVDARLTVAQDPEAWARAGWVDFLSPMNYHTFDGTFLRYLDIQQRAVGDHVPLYPGVAAWRHASPADTIAQVRALRDRGLPGFVLFHLDRRLVREWLPALRLGATANDPWFGPSAEPSAEPEPLDAPEPFGLGP